MALWDTKDTDEGKPVWLSDADKENTMGVDINEAAVNRDKGIRTPGWVTYVTYTDCNGVVRHKTNTLVAASSMTGDNEAEDPALPDVGVKITTQPKNVNIEGGIDTPITLHVKAKVTGASEGVSLTYLWEVFTDEEWVAVPGAVSADLELLGAVESNGSYRVTVTADTATAVSRTAVVNLSVGEEEEVVYFDEVINNILTSGSLSIEALPNYIISPIGEDIPVFPPAIQSDSATEGKWYATLYGNEYDVTDMGFSLGDNGELLLTYEIVSVSFGFPFTYRVTDANSNMVQTQIYVYGELDTGDLDQIKLVDGPNILAAFTSTLEPTELDFTFTNTPTMYLNENIVSLPESAPVYKHPRGYTVGNAIAQVEPTIGLARVTGADYAGPIGYYNNYYKFALISDKVLEDNGYFLHIVCEGLVLVSKPIQYFNSRSNPDGESFPQLADQYVTDFCTHTVDFDDNYATVDQFTGDPNFIPIDDFNQQDTLESSVLFPYIDKKISFVLTTTENLIL